MNPNSRMTLVSVTRSTFALTISPSRTSWSVSSYSERSLAKSSLERSRSSSPYGSAKRSSENMLGASATKVATGAASSSGAPSASSEAPAGASAAASSVGCHLRRPSGLLGGVRRGVEFGGRVACFGCFGGAVCGKVGHVLFRGVGRTEDPGLTPRRARPGGASIRVPGVASAARACCSEPKVGGVARVEGTGPERRHPFASRRPESPENTNATLSDRWSQLAGAP